jgi:hypothetical protein
LNLVGVENDHRVAVHDSDYLASEGVGEGGRGDEQQG